MTRREKMLSELSLSTMTGVEIGPLDKPLVRKEQGTVYYVDFCDTDTLKARWSADPGVDSQVLCVDAIWGRNSLKQALSSAVAGKGSAWTGADYLVASHVVEHVPDLIAWLQEISETLLPDGIVRLAVPDKRYCFDYLRQPSTLGEVLSEYIRKSRVPSAARVLDCTLHMVHVDCGQAWRNQIAKEDLLHVYTVEQAFAIAKDAEENGVYHDVHCWVFTPKSFADLMLALAEMELLSLKCDWIVPTQWDDLEFFVSMSATPGREDCARSWRDALARLDSQERLAPHNGAE